MDFFIRLMLCLCMLLCVVSMFFLTGAIIFKILTGGF